MKLIALTRGFSAIVDDEDFEYLNQWKWHCLFQAKGKHIYAKRTVSEPKKHCLRMHRIIMNCPKNMIVDHINGNTLDNRKENLRICTKNQNNMNISKREKTINKYKGVTKNKARHRPFYAVIGVNKKRIYLGSFYTEIQAAVAYNEAAIKYHGEFAKLNKIPKGEF